MKTTPILACATQIPALFERLDEADDAVVFNHLKFLEQQVRDLPTETIDDTVAKVVLAMGDVCLIAEATGRSTEHARRALVTLASALSFLSTWSSIDPASVGADFYAPAFLTKH